MSARPGFLTETLKQSKKLPDKLSLQSLGLNLAAHSCLQNKDRCLNVAPRFPAPAVQLVELEVRAAVRKFHSVLARSWTTRLKALIEIIRVHSS
jgi:hypothetical protein